MCHNDTISSEAYCHNCHYGGPLLKLPLLKGMKKNSKHNENNEIRGIGKFLAQ